METILATSTFTNSSAERQVWLLQAVTDGVVNEILLGWCRRDVLTCIDDNKPYVYSTTSDRIRHVVMCVVDISALDLICDYYVNVGGRSYQTALATNNNEYLYYAQKDIDPDGDVPISSRMIRLVCLGKYKDWKSYVDLVKKECMEEKEATLDITLEEPEPRFSTPTRAYVRI